nr:MAG TPA: YsxB-like protein [Caudoviricetes sp.]
MIQVIIQPGSIQVIGHAKYAEPGKDIVCAGISTLVQNLVQSIEELTEDEISYIISPGTVDIQYGNLSDKARFLVDSFFIGVSMIADTYPDNVKVIV